MLCPEHLGNRIKRERVKTARRRWICSVVLGKYGVKRIYNFKLELITRENKLKLVKLENKGRERNGRLGN